MTKKANVYIPALRFHWLTGIYDRVLRTTLKERKLKEALVAQTAIKPGHRVLDLGCGTATLTIMLKQTYPDSTILGLDGDITILGIARKKTAAARVEISLFAGTANAPPFKQQSFDRVVSSLVFHHLTTESKRCALARAMELLKPGGELHIADWGQAANALMRVAFLGVQLLDGFETTADNVRGRLVPFMKGAGFAAVAETHRSTTMFGTLSLYRAVRP